MDLLAVRTVVKDLITHTPTGIDTTVDSAINTAIEFITHIVSGIYDEEIWNHKFDAADISNAYDNWALPSTTQYMRKAAYRDVSADEDVYKPLEILSPDDLYNYSSMDKNNSGRGDFVNMPSTDFSGAIRFGAFESYSNRRGVGRVDAEGEPRLIYRLQDNVFVHPRPSSAEVDNWLEIFLIKYCAALSNDIDTNQLTVKFPYVLIHYAAGIIWATKLNNIQRAQSSIQLAASMLQGIASKQEISKLINITTTIGAS